MLFSCSAVSDSLRPHGLSPQGSSALGIFSGKDTGVGCHVLLQGILPTQRSNPGLLHCRRILYHLSHQGRPRIQQWQPIPSPGDLHPGTELGSPALQADSLPAELTGKHILRYTVYYFSYIHNFTCLCHSWHLSTCSLSQMGPLMFITMRNIPPHKPRSQQVSLTFFTHLFLLYHTCSWIPSPVSKVVRAECCKVQLKCHQPIWYQNK